MKNYLPEGQLIDTQKNKSYTESRAGLYDACKNGEILESKVTLCDCEHNLHVDFGCMKGIIYRDDGAYCTDDKPIRDIALISRVNKPVCFIILGFEIFGGVERAVLSRRAVQEKCYEEYISKLAPGDVIPAKITHFEPFGAFCDIGCGIASLISIDCISVSRISHPADRFYIGEEIKAVVKDISDGRVSLSHKELLGTFEQNAASFNVGETVSGIVRSVESYGIFIELAPNFAGLAEPKENVKVGQHASVYIKSIIPEKMKVKLVIIDTFDDCLPPCKLKYYCNDCHIDRFTYSPTGCRKLIETEFPEED